MKTSFPRSPQQEFGSRRQPARTETSGLSVSPASAAKKRIGPAASDRARMKGVRLQKAFFRKLGESALRSLLSLFDTMGDVSFVMKDINGRFMALNARNVSVAGFRSEEDMLGLTSYDYLPEHIAARYTADLRRVVKTGRPVFDETCPLCDRMADSETRVSRVPLRDTRGKIVGIAAVYRIVPRSNGYEDWYGRFQKTAEHINAHCAEKVSIAELVRIAGCGRTKFYKEFQKYFRMPVGDYIALSRVNKARDLLERTDLTLVEIAARTGFCNQSHLVRTFKRFRGITPSRHRRDSRKSPSPPSVSVIRERPCNFFGQ